MTLKDLSGRDRALRDIIFMVVGLTIGIIVGAVLS